jgi:hypothetical protein
MGLQFGLNEVVPQGCPAAWGARWIFPNDQLPDRQATIGEPKETTPLLAWLNKGACAKARANAEKLADKCLMCQDDGDSIILFEDTYGVIIGNPRRSFGYVYVAAFAKGGELPQMASAAVLLKPKPRRQRATK